MTEFTKFDLLGMAKTAVAVHLSMTGMIIILNH